MRNIKHMGLTNLMQPILGTKKIHTIEEDFSKKIMSKNTIQEDFLGKNKASLVLKNENSNGMELFLETLLNLFGQLRSVNTAGNISLTQNIVKQEIIKQIKNNISVSANTYNYSNVTQLFQEFSSESSFSNNEAIENVINVMESELKKNSLGRINSNETKNSLVINATKNSVSNSLWQKVLKKNISNFSALYKGENANFFSHSHSHRFAQSNIKNFTNLNNEYNQNSWNESTKDFYEYSTNVLATPRERISFPIAKNSGETVVEKRTIEGNKTFQVTMADHEKTVFSKSPVHSILNKQDIFHTQNSNYLAELKWEKNFQTTGVEQSFYKNYIQKFTRSQIGNSFLNFIFKSNFNSNNYNSSVLLKQNNKSVTETNVLRLYPTEIQQALFYGNEFNNYTTRKNHQEVNNFLENQRVLNNSISNFNLQKSSFQENFLKRATNTFAGNLYEDINYLNEISQIQQHTSNISFNDKKEYKINFQQSKQVIENEIIHHQNQTIVKSKVQNLVSNLFGEVYFNNKNEPGINNYSILNNSNLTNQLTYSYIKNIWKKQGNNAQYLLKKEESRNILTLFNFNNEKYLFQEQRLTYKENGMPIEGKSDYVFKPLLIENAIERNKFFIKNTAIFSGIYDYSEEFHNEINVKELKSFNREINRESQFYFEENFYKEIEPNTSVFENKTFNKANISFVQRFFKLNARKMGDVLHQTAIDGGSENQLITEVSKNRNSFLSNYFRNNFYINKQLDSNLFSTQKKDYKDVYEEYKAENSNIQFLTQQETYNSTEYKTNKISANNTSNFLTRWIKKYESAVKNKLFLSNSFGFTDVKNQNFDSLLNVSSTVINREEDGEKRNLIFWERLLQPIEFATEGSKFILYYGNKPIGKEKLTGFYPLINKKYNTAVSMGKAKFNSVQQPLQNEANNINQVTAESLYFTNKNSLWVSSEENQSQENVFNSFDIYNSLNRNIDPLKTVTGITQKKYYHTTDYTETVTNRFLTQLYQKNRLFSIRNRGKKILVEGESKMQGTGSENGFLNGLINPISVGNTAETDTSKGIDFNSRRTLKTTSFGSIPKFGGHPIDVAYKEQPWEENNKKYIENYEVKNSIIHRTKTEEVKTEQEIEEQIKKSVLIEVEEKITKKLLSFKQQQVKEEEEKRKLDLLQQENIEKNDTNSVLNAVEDIDIIYEKVYEKMERALRSERRRIGR